MRFRFCVEPRYISHVIATDVLLHPTMVTSTIQGQQQPKANHYSIISYTYIVLDLFNNRVVTHVGGVSQVGLNLRRS